jgi:hypothetical protein
VYSDFSTNREKKLEDEITVHGQILQGRIIRLKRDGVEFSTAYAKESLAISYKDIDNIVSQRRYLIFHGGNQLERGKLLGLENGQILVGIDERSVQRVAVNEIEIGVTEASYEASFWTRMHTDYRYWRGNLDAGFAYETGAVDKNKIQTGLNLQRRKKPTVIIFDFRYAYETQQKKDNPEVTTKDELDTFLLAEYDITDPFYLFARPAYEFDKPRNIDYRWYPAAGIGYRLIDKENERTFLHFPVGIGYIDEDFGDIGTDSFISWYFGLSGSYDFGRGMVLSAWALYMPKIDDPGDDWLLRTELDFSVPLFDPIAVRLRLTNVNDNNPTPEVGENKFTAAILLSLMFNPP